MHTRSPTLRLQLKPELVLIMSSGPTADIDLSGQERGTTSSCHGPAVSKVQPKVLLSRPLADGLIMPTGSDPQSVQSYCFASGARVYNPGEQMLTNDHAIVFTWWLGGLP